MASGKENARVSSISFVHQPKKKEKNKQKTWKLLRQTVLHLIPDIRHPYIIITLLRLHLHINDQATATSSSSPHLDLGRQHSSPGRRA